MKKTDLKELEVSLIYNTVKNTTKDNKIKTGKNVIKSKQEDGRIKFY